MPFGGVSRFAANQRSETRCPVQIAAALRVPSVKGGMYLVTILDVSRSGMRISASAGFPVGTQVQISFAEMKLEGEIRYAREIETGEFHLGIQISAGQEVDLLKRLNIKE